VFLSLLGKVPRPSLCHDDCLVTRPSHYILAFFRAKVNHQNQITKSKIHSRIRIDFFNCRSWTLPKKSSTVKLMNNKSISILAGLVGVVLIIVAIIYWRIPAGSLPHYFPGYFSGSSTIHFKHGLASLILGLGALALAWFRSGKKSA
jgi:hypothetical protein